MGRNHFPFWLVVSIVSLGFLWIVFAKVLVPPVIKSAYRGESLQVLNWVIAEQEIYPIDRYLEKWNEITWRVPLSVFMAGLILCAITRLQSARYLEAGKETSGTTALAVEPLKIVGRRRLLVVHAVIAFILGGSLSTIAISIDYWPFSHYSMYSEVAGPVTRKRCWFGITENGETPLTHLAQYLGPFDDIRFGVALGRLERRPQGPQLLNNALRDLLNRYEAMRIAGIHDGPPLRGLRLYLLEWKLDASVRNADRPEGKKLIHELILDEKY